MQKKCPLRASSDYKKSLLYEFEEGDDGWAQYYVVVGNNDEKQLSQDEWPSFIQDALGIHKLKGWS